VKKIEHRSSRGRCAPESWRKGSALHAVAKVHLKYAHTSIFLSVGSHAFRRALPFVRRSFSARRKARATFSCRDGDARLKSCASQKAIHDG
jgi:hypothetical protein